jgi:tRNA uridine 5-carboxymethylaminomethyl modification enzyme
LSKIREKRQKIQNWSNRLENERAQGGTWGDLIRRATNAPPIPAEFLGESREVREEVLYRIKYRGYLIREERLVRRFDDIEKIRIPADLDYAAISGLRRESAVKLAAATPMTLGQASRISGVNPADISLLMVLIEARRRAHA